MYERHQELEDESNALEFLANIAQQARRDELVSFVKDIISKNGWNKDIELCQSTTNYLSEYPDRITFKSNAISTFIHLDIEKKPDGSFCSKVKMSGLDYVSIYSLSNSKDDSYSSDARYSYYRIVLLKFFMALVDSLDSLDILLNSDTFNAYREDIKKYIDSKDKIKQYDNYLFEEKKNKIKNSFYVGAKIKIGTTPMARECLITKVCNKRLYVDNYKRFCHLPCQKTMDKDEAASNIAKGYWSLLG